MFLDFVAPEVLTLVADSRRLVASGKPLEEPAVAKLLFLRERLRSLDRTIATVVSLDDVAAVERAFDVQKKHPRKRRAR